MQTLLLNSIINLEQLLQNTRVIKCHNIHGDNDPGSYEINLPCYGGGAPEEWLGWKDKLLKDLNTLGISTGPKRYIFIVRLLTGDAKATFNHVTLDIGIHTVDDFNKLHLEMTKHAFPVYAFCKQNMYLHRHLVNPKSMKLLSFISRLQDLKAYFAEYPPDTEGQETASLTEDEIMDIIYHSMPTT